ncbi:MAG: hypothetical protein Ct9H90mP16_00400 [Candidatus Poseidoniales archaeon]|nr:MAG: hypothetical protein Ct9H90mP16_00400 [Candidatus Poseidoniales archaeon]
MQHQSDHFSLGTFECCCTTKWAETEMEFEQLGPFTYELTTKREVLYHDANPVC